MKKRPNLYRCHPTEALEARTLFTAVSAGIAFAPHVDFVTGTAPIALVASDFNGDGNVDLAVADHTTDKVNIFFGNGTGSFAAGPVLSLSAPPAAIVTGDFNGDSKPDIAIAETAGIGQTTTAVAIFLNAGAGAFGVGQITTVETGVVPGEPIALAAADFNADGKLDLAVTEYTAQSIAILSGNGTGTFAAPIAYNADQYPTAIVSADFNNDGYPDLAVTSTSANYLSGATSDSSASNQVSLLLDSATGDFTAGPNIGITTGGIPTDVAIGNFTTATTPGLIVGNSDSTVSVFTNTAGAFASSAVATLPGASTSVASGDFNLDGNTDFISATAGTTNSTITVVPGIGAGMISATSSEAVGAQPAGAVVADFNNDGKPDIATANTLIGTVSILLNTTVIPLVSTTTTLTTTSASAPAGTSINLTATVTDTAASSLPGESLPTGTVKFYDGATLLGSSPISDATNQAIFSTASLAVGTHSVRAVYSGDTAYAASTSTRLSQVIAPTATQGPDLIGTFVSSTFPGVVAPGETGTVKILVTNQGNTIAAGLILNSVYLSLDPTIDPGDAQLNVRGSLAHANVHLLPGKSVTLVGTVTIPQNTSLASYSLLTTLNPSGSLAESVSTNNVSGSPSLYAVSDVFGTVDGRAGVMLQTTDNNGTASTFRLTGPGNGVINVGDSVQVLLDGTTAASVLTVTSPRGSSSFTINSLSADSRIGSIRAAGLTVLNSLSLPGGATAVTLASVGTGAASDQVSIGPGASTALAIATVPGVSLTATGGLRSLTVGNWMNGTISAGFISMLHSTGLFSANLSLSGVAAPGNVINSAVIGGIASGTWNINGNAGRISIASTPAVSTAFSLSDSGLLKSISFSSTFFGLVSAAAFGQVLIRGDLSGGKIVAQTNIASVSIQGTVINSDVLAATIAAGTLGNFRVTGSVTNTLVGAGAVPDATSNPSVTVNSDGTIRSLTVLGTVDSQSRFLAAILPKRAILNRVAVDPTADPHFHL